MTALYRILIILLAFNFSGCTSTVKQAESDDLAFSISTTRLQVFRLADYSSLEFEPVRLSKDDPLLGNTDTVLEGFELILQEQLQPKLGTSGSQAIKIRYGIASDAMVDDQQLLDFFGLSPGLSLGENSNKVTIALSILDVRTNSILWKGSAQGIFRDSKSRALIRQRVRSIMAQMMDDL